MLFRRARRYAVATFLSLAFMSCAGGSGTQRSGATGSLSADPAPQIGQGDPLARTDINIYVSPKGSDHTGSGSLEKPYATINRALQDVPTLVSQHYVVTLSPGTYYEEVDIAGRIFAGTTVGNFNKAAIELKGDRTSPDNYVISAASQAAPTIPQHAYVVQCVFANCILNGVSLQFASIDGFHQVSGFSVINSSTFRHFTSPKAAGIFIDTGAISELRGNNTVDDVYLGIEVAHGGRIYGYREGTGGDILNTGFPEPENQTVSGVRADGCGINIYDDALYDVSNITSISCVGKPSCGLQVGDYGDYDSETTTISGCSTSVLGYVHGRIEINLPTFSNADTAVQMIWNSRLDFIAADPNFVNVATQYSLSGGSVVSTPTQNLFDGSLTSTGSVSISAGGTNENVTLTPRGTGSIVLNGLVGIGGPSSGAKLMISGAGGSQTYVNVNDTDAHKDTLIKLDTEGNSDDSFFLKARVDGNDKWWVKADGSAFSTSFSTALSAVLFSPTPTFDISLGNTQKIILSGDVTGSNLLNALPGEYLFFIVCQDPNGGHKFTWPPNFKGAMNIGGQDVIGNIIGVAPLACSAQSFVYDGTNAYALSPGVFNM